MTYKLAELAKILNAELHGDAECLIDAPGTLQDGRAGEIGFLAEASYKQYLSDCKLSALICNEIVETPANLLIVKDVKSAWRQLLELFVPEALPPEISAQALISPQAKIGQNCRIEAGVIIEANAEIAANSHISAGAIIERGVIIGENAKIGAGVKILQKTRIGKNVEIAAGAVIGSRGFGLSFENGKWQPIPQLGGVWIGDDVEIGACTTIDCGAIRDTIIEDGVKLDNHIQIAHNVHIGAHTLMAGCCVVAGSVRFGKYCVVGGACVFAGHINICDGAKFTGHSSISKSIDKPGVYSSGFPAVAEREWKRFVAGLKILLKNKN